MLLSTTWTSLFLWVLDADAPGLAPFQTSVFKTSWSQVLPFIPLALCDTAKTASQFQLERFRIWVLFFWLKMKLTQFKHPARQVTASFWHQNIRTKPYHTEPVWNKLNRELHFNPQSCLGHKKIFSCVNPPDSPVPPFSGGLQGRFSQTLLQFLSDINTWQIEMPRWNMY